MGHELSGEMQALQALEVDAEEVKKVGEVLGGVDESLW